MRQLLLICLIVLPSLIQAETISLTVPSAVAEQIDVYRASCAEDGGQLELDGDEVFKVWTDEGQEAYVIHAAFTCGSLGCPTTASGRKRYESILSIPGLPAALST